MTKEGWSQLVLPVKPEERAVFEDYCEGEGKLKARVLFEAVREYLARHGVEFPDRRHRRPKAS